MPPFTACEACSGPLRKVAAEVALCMVCGGVHGTEAALENVVDLRGRMQLDTEDPRYFVAITAHGRVHGWFDPITTHVVQWG